MAFFFTGKKSEDCRLLPALDSAQTAQYRRFRRLLAHNRTAMTLQADLEQIYYDNRPFFPQMVEQKWRQLLLEADGMVHALAAMTRKEYAPLVATLGSIERTFSEEWRARISHRTDLLVIPLEQIEKEQAREVGTKAANLAYIRRELALPTPDGFAITAGAFERYLQETGLAREIDGILAELSDDDPVLLAAASRRISARITATPIPAPLLTALTAVAALFPLEQRLAVRSSALGEDSTLSFAGQYTSVLNVSPVDLPRAYQEVVASTYSTSALSYRMQHGIDDRETPMAVLVLTMVQPRFSGVLYTADPTGADRDKLRVSVVSGLGNQLVGGDTSPQHIFRINKGSYRILEGQENSGQALVDMGFLEELAHDAVRMENHFQHALDIEWAVATSGQLFILQVRPLLVVPVEQEEGPELAVEYPGHPLRLQGGKCAAGGVVSGRVRLQAGVGTGEAAPPLEPGTILVARTASIAITPWVSRIKGIITDIGSPASHLASVAREFGVPALFDTRSATSAFKEGETITLWASQARVYQGVVDPLIMSQRRVRRPIFDSPAHQRLQRLLDRIAPLNLTNPASAEFSPEHCRTVHDIIRYCHELSVRYMFNFGETVNHTQNAVQLKVTIPIQLYALDLGGGLRQGLTTCDEASVHDVVSAPFTALWRGFSHPGITWTSAIAVGAQDFLSLMMAGARPQDNRLGEASYAFLAGDYLNLNIRFGYHFASVDALCGPNPEQNYVTLHFAGGAGGYHGRSLRIQLLVNVLARLGFETSSKGDLLEASLMRLDQRAQEETLDQVGRLLGASRLLDMALKNPEQVATLTESFFQGRYDFLEAERQEALPAFYLITGDWKISDPEREPGILQDGSHRVSVFSTAIAQTMIRFMGKRYLEFLDNIEAYYYFPLLIAKESSMAEGAAQVWVKPLAGTLAQAGGLAFAIRDWGNYFVFRINALEGDGVLFEFKNGKSRKRQGMAVPLALDQWQHLRVEIQGQQIRVYLNDRQILEYGAERILSGYLGLWTKADSVALFREFTMQPCGGEARLLQ